MTDQEILLLLGYTAETFQNYALPTRGEQLDLRITVWRDHLGDLDAGIVRAAIGAAAAEPWPPQPGELRERALRLAGWHLPPDADEAVAEISSAVRRLGHTETPVWSHPAIADTVEAIGGWQEVCRSTNPEAMRAHLLRLYATASLRARRAETLAPAFTQLVSEAASRLALDSEVRQVGPPAESVSALRSPAVDRDDAEGLRQVRDVRARLAELFHDKETSDGDS